MTKVRIVLAATVCSIAVGSLCGCVQFGDYVGESDLRCAERAVSFETYLSDKEGIDTASVHPAGTGTAGQCVIDVVVRVPSSSTQQDLVTVSATAVDSMEFAGYTPSETTLDIQVEDGDLLHVLPPSIVTNDNR